MDNFVQNEIHHVVIVGGGFGGLQMAQALKNAPVRVTLIDRRNFHLFQPLLYQVATASLSPNNITSVMRRVLRWQENTQVLLAEARGVDATQKLLLLDDGELHYDTLIVATGVGPSYFGHDEWKKLAPGLKTIEDATEIRRRILLAFEAAERTNDPHERERWLTFVIVGAGPTGVELAGAVSEIANHSLKHDFRSINPSHAKIILVEGGDRVLAPFPSTLSAKAAIALEKRGITLKTNAIVISITENEVTYRTGDKEYKIPTRTVLWAAGVQASPLGQALAETTGVQLDRAGRVMVQPDLTIPNHPEILVIGDLAHLVLNGKQLPGVAQVAMQQGTYAAQLIRDRLDGKKCASFHYVDLGNMATIGRSAAVVSVGSLQLSGFLAWLAWAFVHLMQLVRFQNRILVLAQWSWLYLTWNRSARLITGKPLLPGSHSKVSQNYCILFQKNEKERSYMIETTRKLIKANWMRALIGGFVGTVIFTLMGMVMAPNIIGQPMDVAVLLAPMLGGSYAAGFVAHFFTGTVVLPLLYLLIGAQYIPGPGWLRGVLFLIPLYLIAMTVVMPLIGQGLFFNNPPKAMVALMGHIVYGLCMGAIIGRPQKN